MTESFLSLGKVVGTHGLKGGMKVYAERGILSPKTQNLSIRFEPNLSAKLFRVSSISKQKLLVLKFEEINSIDEAEKYIGKEIYLIKSEVPLPDPHEIYEFQLLGLIPHEKGTIYSDFKVTSVLENPAHPILEFSNTEIQILVPYIERYVGSVDLVQGFIEVHDWDDWIHAL